MTTPVPAEPRSTPPPWLVPVGIGLIIALLAALIVVLLTRNDDSDSTTPVTTEAPVDTTTPSETLPQTTVAETTPPETAPATTVPPTDPTTTVPVVEEVDEGQALLLAGSDARRFSVVATCSDFWAGVQTTSHVLVDDATQRVWVVDVFAFEEGGSRGMLAMDMEYAIAANLFGQDVPLSPSYSGEIDESEVGMARAVMERISGDGPASVTLTLGEPRTTDDCAVGWYAPESPFAPGAQVQWMSPDESSGQRFMVLADCGGELLVTGGGLILTNYPQDGSTMSAGLVNNYNITFNDVWWTNLDTPTPDETAFEQGGGGDITAAVNVYPDGDRSAAPGYLSWTERPLRSAVGSAGLLDNVCVAGP